MCSRPVIQRFALHGQHLTNVKVITMALFQVPVSPYLSQCVTDTCGCNVSFPFPQPSLLLGTIKRTLNLKLLIRLGAIASVYVLQWPPTPLPVLRQELLSSESSFPPLLNLKSCYKRWRSQAVCPLQCAHGSTYSECRPACPVKTCDNQATYERQTLLCM